MPSGPGKTEIELFQRSANIAQVYGIASVIRTAAEEASSLSGICLEQKHVEHLGRIAKQADQMCCEIMNEWDKIKAELAAK